MKKNKKYLNSKCGFTLVELLVVIAIIALIASVLLVSINNSRKKARDATRAGNLKTLAHAAELYALNNGGSFFVPSHPHCYDSSTVPHCGVAYSCESGSDWPDEFKNAMKPYLSSLPKDALMNCSNPPYRKYVYMSDGKDYKIEFLDPEYPYSLPSLIDPTFDGGPTAVGPGYPYQGSCSGPGDGTDVTAWAVYTLGGECWNIFL